MPQQKIIHNNYRFIFEDVPVDGNFFYHTLIKSMHIKQKIKTVENLKENFIQDVTARIHDSTFIQYLFKIHGWKLHSWIQTIKMNGQNILKLCYLRPFAKSTSLSSTHISNPTILNMS